MHVYVYMITLSLSLSLSTYVGFIHELFFVLSCCLVFECVDTVSVPMVGLDWTRLDSTLIVFVSTMVCIPPKKKTRSRHDPSTVGLVCVNSIVQYVRCMYKISRVFFVLVVLLVSLSYRIISYRMLPIPIIIICELMKQYRKGKMTSSWNDYHYYYYWHYCQQAFHLHFHQIPITKLKLPLELMILILLFQFQFHCVCSYRHDEHDHEEIQKRRVRKELEFFLCYSCSCCCC